MRNYSGRMKIKSDARRLVKIRAILFRLLIAALVGTWFCLGESFASRIGQTTGVRTAGPPIPNVSANCWP